MVASSRHSRVRSLSLNSFCCFTTAFSRLDAEWISTKKDWQDAKRRAKERQGSDTVPQEHTVERPAPLDPILNDIVLELPLNGEAGHPGLNSKETSRDSAEYQPEMDEMRCILYAHGGKAPSILRRLLV
jgi:hypothetical protein